MNHVLSLPLATQGSTCVYRNTRHNLCASIKTRQLPEPKAFPNMRYLHKKGRRWKGSSNLFPNEGLYLVVEQ